MITSDPQNMKRMLDNGYYLSVSKGGLVYLEKDGFVVAGDPVTATVGGAALGAAGSLIGGSKAAKGAERAADAQADSARYAADLQRDMYYQGRTDSMPYASLGAVSAPMLQYLVTGVMPTMTPQELDMISQYNQSMSPQASTGQPQQGQPAGPASFYDEIRARTSDDNKTANFLEGLRTGWQTDGINAPNPMQAQTMNAMQAQQGTSALDLDQYALQNALAKQQALSQMQGMSPEDIITRQNPFHQFELDQGNRAINAAMANRGKLNSSVAVNALGQYAGDLGLKEVDRTYGRLMDLTNIGRGAQTSNAGLGANYAANAGNALMAGGSAQAAGINSAAQTRGSMYSNLGALPLNVYNQMQYNNALSNFSQPYGGSTASQYTPSNPYSLISGNYSLTEG